MPEDEDMLIPVPGIDNLTYEDANILLRFQRLWIELILWMRNFFHSALENLPDLATVTARVFQQMPQDFFNEFSKYFGPEESQRFLNLFSRLVAINWQLVNAYKENNQAAIDESTVLWYRAADEIADFLAGVNQYWDEDEIRTVLHKYIQLKIAEIIAFLNNDYDQELQIFNELEGLVTRMAASLAMGIIARRPQRLEPPFQAQKRQ
ncbi:MAG TPA: hypothetical protein VN381_02335 [Anaerovoracaceae bacterium]|nr:hypothetical protein [Anaerovoracaceae bacterium]